MTIWERAKADENLVDLVRRGLDKAEIEGYGKRLLKSWFRRKRIIL
jgi:hypothetical protein